MNHFAKFEHSVSITIPSTVDIDNGASQEKIDVCVERVVKVFADVFGGATVTKADGAWFSAELHKVVYEPVVIVTSYHDGSVERAHSLAEAMAEVIRDDMSQECVAYTIDGVMYLV